MAGVVLTDWSAELASTYVPLLQGLVETGVPVTVCVRDDADAARGQVELEAEGIDPTRIDWTPCPLDTVWMRDYGPLYGLDPDGALVYGDAVYAMGRPLDDAFPVLAASWDDAVAYQVPVALEGGNLLSDGTGRCLTTTAATQVAGLTEQELGDRLAAYAGCDDLVVLTPLQGEVTGHVDTFAILLDEGTVAVGRYDPAYDPVNASILDDNAVALGSQGYEVLRVDMPGHHDGNGDDVDDFRTYTNAIPVRYGEDPVLLVPVYDDDTAVEAGALDSLAGATDLRVVPVPADRLIELGGAVHCVVKTVPVATGSAPLEPRACGCGTGSSVGLWWLAALAASRRRVAGSAPRR